MMAGTKADAGRHLGAWGLGLVAVAAPWLAIRHVPVDVNKWSSIYIAGALGGLALEMLLGRGRVELPSPSTVTDDDQKEDDRRPLGPVLDLGFLARLSSSGIAATALLLVYYALVESTDSIAAFNELAEAPSTFGWAVFLGASSPAIWTASQRMVKHRIDAVVATNETDLKLKKAELDKLVAQAELAADRLRDASVPATTDSRSTDAATLSEIEAVVGEAAAADEHEVDVPALSLNLFSRLPRSPVSAADLSARPNADGVREALAILEAGVAGLDGH